MLFDCRNRSRKSRRPVKPFTLLARWNAARLRLEAMDERVVPAFLDAVNYAAGINPQAVVAADFNNDGVLDLAIANAGDRTVSVLLGNVNGTFRPAISSAAGNSPSSLAVGDFNADGKLDLVTGDATNGPADVCVLLGQGDGAFQSSFVIDLDSSNSGAQSVAVGDFNADGKLDLGVLSNYSWSGRCGDYGQYSCGGTDGMVAVLLGTGTGTFGGPTWFGLGEGYHTFMTVSDFNADGKLDIASGSGGSGIHVALGSGSGTFDYSNSFYNGGAYALSVVATDVNNDGNVDLAVTNFGDFVSALLGNGAGWFSSPQFYAGGSGPELAVADFNGDATIDLITTSSNSATVGVLLGTGTSAFRPPVTAAVGSTPSGVAVGDFNGDGRMDAVSTNSASNNVSVLLNDGAWPAIDAPSIAVNDVVVTEGNTGTVNATFTVSLSAAFSQTVSVHYDTADGTATVAGGDYQATSGTLTFSPGQISKTVVVPVNGDRLGELIERFTVNLSSVTNGFIADGQGVGTIIDDEPRVSIGDATVVEGNTGTRVASFTVTISAASDQPVIVAYTTTNGTATAPGDYPAASDTLTLIPGETSKTLTLVVNGDRLAEPDETFFVNLSNPTNAILGDSIGAAVIVDDEPRISIGDVTRSEGRKGQTTAFTFTVTLSAAYDQPVTVSFRTTDGTARAGEDYIAKTGTLTFAPGETTKTITISVTGDNAREGNESFYVDMFGNSGNSLVSTSRGIGWILNDDGRR